MDEKRGNVINKQPKRWVRRKNTEKEELRVKVDF